MRPTNERKTIKSVASSRRNLCRHFLVNLRRAKERICALMTVTFGSTLRLKRLKSCMTDLDKFVFFFFVVKICHKLLKLL